MNARQLKIQDLINKNGQATLSELEQLFPEISSMTLRRDLGKLESIGEIVRTKSGAKSIAHLARLKEDLYSTRATFNISEKTLIAQKAHTLVEQGCSIFLDSGTTVMQLASLLSADGLFVITTSPNIALECAKNPNISVFLTGGRLNNDNLSLSGMNALAFLNDINIDIAFLAASGFSLKNAFTCGSFDECQIKKRVIEKAATVTMLMDHTKYGRSLPFTFANLSDIDYFVTDDLMDQEFLNHLKKYKIEVK